MAAAGQHGRVASVGRNGQTEEKGDQNDRGGGTQYWLGGGEFPVELKQVTSEK